MKLSFNIGLRNSLGLFFALFLLFSCQKQGGIISLYGKTMGTTYTVRYFPTFKESFYTSDQVQIKIDSLLKEINQEMSTYIKSSEISKINQDTSEDWVSLSPRLFEVLMTAQNVHDFSKGAFDMTVGPLVNLWGFGPDGERKVPDQKKLREVREKVGHNLLKLDALKNRIKKEKGVYVDLSAIAKGLGVDKVGNLLSQLGIKSYMVEIGGEIKVKGDKNGKPWRLAIETPSKSDRVINKIINVKDMAMATSGNYRNYFKSGNKFFSHTIDPRTGRPVKHQLASVTVFHPESCMIADAYATALMVMGPEKGPKFAEKQGILAFFIYGSKGAFEERSTAGLKQIFKEFL